MPEDVKRERIVRLVDLVQEHAARHNAALVGSMQEVLVEGRSRTDHDVWRGRTRTNKTVNFTGSAEPGELVRRPRRALQLPDADRPRGGIRRRAVSALAVFWPDCVGQEPGGTRAGPRARRRDRLLRRDADVPGPADPDQPAERGRAGGGPAPPGRRLGARAPWLGRRVRRAGTGGDRRHRRARAACRCCAAAAASTCAPRWRRWMLPPEPEQGARDRFEALYDELGPAGAHELLAERDPAAAERIHPNDRRRVVRALELAEQGRSLAPDRGRPLGAS